MREFIDREIAIKSMNKILTEHTTPWIVLSGDSRIGKTEFAKKISSMYENTIFCTPRLSGNYACSFVQSINLENEDIINEIICEYAKKNASANEVFKAIGMKYVSPLRKNQLSSVLSLIIKNDVSSGLYNFAHYLGEQVNSQINCIFLDDFSRCDYDSYVWILEYWNSIMEPLPTVIAICNFSVNWESGKLKDIFHGVCSPVSIERFDSKEAFYNILKQYFFFENDIYLVDISKKLFALYNGNAGMLFETIKLLQGQTIHSTDEQMTDLILNTAQQIHLHRFDEFSKIHMLVLRTLAYSPSPLSKKNVIDILDLIEPITTEIISQLYNRNFINYIADNNNDHTLYVINDDFLISIIKSGCSETEELFYKTKLYRAIQRKQINATLEQKLNLAIELEENEVMELIIEYLESHLEECTDEKKAYYIDKFLNSKCKVPEKLISIYNVQLLYLYGYYQSAEKLIGTYYILGGIVEFENLMLLGDIQHILLSPKTSHTYKSASEVIGISVSDKIKAINRQIMALNQEHKEQLAKELYESAFDKYENTPCSGLIELYRNSNNSFDYDRAMEYTIRGCVLAKELGEVLEMYKCLHNICMIRLQHGKYGQPICDERLYIEPTFEYIVDFFAKHSEYRHEQAYPLLDLGTVKMFEYVRTHDAKLLIEAKRYYSEAQLYAKSFYAQHIAETGLLIVNSYQYAYDESTFVQELRDTMYNRYVQKQTVIEDYRVHKKILLSLALSAIISGNNEDATMYLNDASKYISGAETLRYNKLCQKAGCVVLMKEPVPLNGKNEIYYGSDELVPWLISFCH